MTTRIFFTINTEREIHFPGRNTSVAVCWDIDPSTCARKPNQAPYIAFIDLPESPDGGSDVYEDEDCFVEGVMDIVSASALADELTVAVNYIRLHPHA